MGVMGGIQGGMGVEGWGGGRKGGKGGEARQQVEGRVQAQRAGGRGQGAGGRRKQLSCRWRAGCRCRQSESRVQARQHAGAGG